MIGAIVDRVVGVFSPAAAAKRTHARAVYNNLSKRNYDAAASNRTTSSWRAINRSADLELLNAAATIRARTRDLVRNNAYARGILRALVRNVISSGIVPQATVANGDTPNEKFNTTAESLFARWQLECDVTGRLSFYEMQQLAYRERHEAGEVLIHRVNLPNPRRVLPLALELIDADRLADDRLFPRGVNRDTGNEVRRGVEINAAGQPVAYWIYPHHPNDVNTLHTRPERMDASEFIHLFRQERIGQTRGVSSFAPVIRTLKDLGYYLENELQSSAVASCFAVAVKTISGEADGGLLGSVGDDSTDDRGNRFEHLEPGLVGRLMPGEEIEVINPNRQNAAAGEWLNFLLRQLAVGMGLSYERLTRDYSKTNFSSNRASDLEDRREFEPEQQWLSNSMCRPVWHWFMQSAVSEGKEEFPSPFEFIANYDLWTSHRWQPPGWDWVDPRNQAIATETALKNNLTTLAIEHGKQGRDWREVLKQRSTEKEAAETLGLIEEAEDKNAPQETPEDEAATP